MLKVKCKCKLCLPLIIKLLHSDELDIATSNKEFANTEIQTYV